MKFILEYASYIYVSCTEYMKGTIITQLIGTIEHIKIFRKFELSFEF